MWVANFLRALADVIEGGARRNTRKQLEKAENLLQLISDLNSCKERMDSLIAERQLTEGEGNEYGLSTQDYINLRIQEYNTLRSEQRTRLDAANRLIHYNVLVIGAIVAGLIAIYKTENMNIFPYALQNALLLLPLLSMPFTFTQWNDEIIVDDIGRYLDRMKGQITNEGDSNYWNWEKEHNLYKHTILTITAVIRSGFFPLFALCSLIAHQVYHYDHRPSFWEFIKPPSELFKATLFVADVLLIGLAISTVIGMAWRKSKRSKYYRDLKASSSSR
jgi:hypothetical protein